MIYRKSLQLLRCAVGSEQFFPEIASQEWPAIYEMAQQQSLTGVLFEAIERRGRDEIGIPFDLLLEWTVAVEQINGANKHLNQVSAKVAAHFEKQGFQTCILKGQGNALMYPKPECRIPGDVDIWVKPLTDGTDDTNIREIIKHARKTHPEAKAIYHHIDAGLYDGVEEEIHYRPSFMFNPVHNHKLQQWYKEKANEQFRNRVALPDGVGTIAIPTNDFNIIFQLSHIYNHVLHEGIGLRQIVDYYYLLRKYKVDGLECKNSSKDIELEKALRNLGLWKIAMAMMWVLSEVLGLEERYLITPKDEKTGKVLLTEILRGGNFGHYDTNNIQAANSMRRNWQRIKRDIRMMRYFPSECFWEPVFRVYHFFWRKVYRT